MSKLSEGISLQQLISGGAEFEVQLEDEAELANDEYSPDENIHEELLKFSNLNLLQDEDTYNEGEPFEIIGKGMTNLIPDGGVKKKILKQGYGDTPPNLALVKVDYNAYIEYEPQPFDSTYSRRRKHEFTINNAEVIEGLDIAVQSMRLTEKSQFLITPTYAYGAMGCLGRVPKNATVLFEIELHETVDSGAAISYNKLTEEKKREFDEVYKHCLALTARAKQKYDKNNIMDAVKEYNSAAAKLERVEMKDYSEQEKQQELIFRLYTNILVCYTTLEEPKRGCTAANKIYEMLRDQPKKIPSKVYFCNAKCLRMLGDFTAARKRLEKAHRITPRSPEIANEFILLKEDIEKHKENEKRMAKAFSGTLSSSTKK